MTTDEVDMEIRIQLHLLLNDVWEGITTIWPEYRDAGLPFLCFITDGPEDEAAYFTPPLPDDLNAPMITLNLNPEYAPQDPHELSLVCEVLLAHELTHHLQYLRGEGGYGSTGVWKQFDPGEQEADEMTYALFWDKGPGKHYRELQAMEAEPEDDKYAAEWFRNLYENAKARRMLWERIEKELALWLEET